MASGTVPRAIVRMPLPAPCSTVKTPEAATAPNMPRMAAPSGCRVTESRADIIGWKRFIKPASRMRAPTCDGPISAPCRHRLHGAGTSRFEETRQVQGHGGHYRPRGRERKAKDEHWAVEGNVGLSHIVIRYVRAR